MVDSRMRKILLTIASSLVFTMAVAQTTVNDLPIADVHRHVHSWVSPSSLQSEMQQLNIGWSGGVGAPHGPFDTKPYADLLQSKYIRTIGQVAFADVQKYKGARGLEDPSTPEFVKLFEEAEARFASGEIKGFGELILNNENTTGYSSFKRKAKINSPTMVKIFEIADKWRGFVNIHAEEHPDSVAEIIDIASKFPKVSIILAHCLFAKNTQLVDDILAKHGNIYCELSARNASIFRRFYRKTAMENGKIVFDDKNIYGDWKQLIEKYPTRFMVGTDPYNRSVDVKAAIFEIRNGLLANLKPDVAEQVAYKNAVRIMNLE